MLIKSSKRAIRSRLPTKLPFLGRRKTLIKSESWKSVVRVTASRLWHSLITTGTSTMSSQSRHEWVKKFKHQRWFLISLNYLRSSGCKRETLNLKMILCLVFTSGWFIKFLIPKASKFCWWPLTLLFNMWHNIRMKLSYHSVYARLKRQAILIRLTLKKSNHINFKNCFGYDIIVDNK